MAAKEEVWTIRRLLDWTTRFLAEKGSESPGLDASVLLGEAMQQSRVYLYSHADEIPDESARTRYRELIQRRVDGCPVAYLVGRKEFYSLSFEVSPAVLIPRPDSETLAAECLARLKESGATASSVLDLGTGSGNLAVAIARHHPSARVTAVDLSPEALTVARRNAERHGVTERVTFLEGDLYQPLPSDARFDVIVSNPPYIPTAEIAGLEVGVRDHEPHLALDGGPDGYAVLDRIVAGAAERLLPGGWLLVEIGTAQERPVRERIEATGRFCSAKTVVDSGRHPRVVIAQLRERA